MFNWFLVTKLGRLFSGALTGLVILLGVFAAGMRKGRETGRTRELKQTVKTKEKAKEKADEVQKKSPSAVMRDLDGWMRDDDE